MKAEVRKFTGIDEAKEFITASLNDHKDSKIKNFRKLYLSEHSPMYTQIFEIKLSEIPSYVSTHLRTHKKNFLAETVTTNRVDRGGSETAGRLTPVDMIIYCNAKTLVDMSLKRLCNKADNITREVMSMIKEEVRKVDKDLFRFMVPQCIYRCGLCQEWKSCGFIKTDKFKTELRQYLDGFEDNYFLKLPPMTSSKP